MDTIKPINKLLTIPLLSFMAVNVILPTSFISNAAPIPDDNVIVNDDPGYGRLSGNDVPEEFYEGADNSLLPRYGSSQSASPYTGKTYTHQDQFDGTTLVNGVDVSQYQKDIDWTKVKSAGIDFAFIRVGGRGWGKPGTLFKDSKYDTNMANATAAGVQKGIYIYSQAITEAEAVAEAQYILDRIGSYTVELPLILDYEFASTGTSSKGRLENAKLSKEDATDICLAFCETIYNAGYTPMVYANPDMLNNHLNRDVISASYPVWLANYTTSTSYSDQFTYWQYSDAGSVDGIDGKVDMDFYYAPPQGSISPAIVTPIKYLTYTGEALTPSFTVTLNSVTLVENKDYTVSYSNNTEVGIAHITLTGIGDYTGVRNVTFRIIVPGITDLKAKKKTTKYITLTWGKKNDVTGYEIYRSDSPNGTYKRIKTITKKSTTTYKNTKLTAGQCYYYKIRTYKKSGGNTDYSEFSEPVAIYTKTGYTRLAIAKENTQVYSDTSTDSEIVLIPEEGTTMNVTYCTKDDSGNKWYKISSDGVTGFVRSGNATIAKQGKIKSSKVNVRKKASVKSKKVTTLKKSKKVLILKSKKKKGVTWYNVQFNKSGKTYKGWISAAYVKII